MGNEVVKAQEQAIVQYERVEVVGADALGPEDMIIPRVRIRQPVSGFGTPQDAGKFHNNITEVFSETLEVVIFKVAVGQGMWPETFSGDSKPLCASDDARTPRFDDGTVSDPQPGPCADCPYSRWGENGKPPGCSRVYTYLCVDTQNDNMPFFLSAMRTSAAAAKKLNTLAKMQGMTHLISVDKEFRSEDKGQWYELRFKVVRKLEPAELQEYRQMQRMFLNIDVTVDTENTAGVEGTDALDPDDFADAPNAETGEPLAF